MNGLRRLVLLGVLGGLPAQPTASAGMIGLAGLEAQPANKHSTLAAFGGFAGPVSDTDFAAWIKDAFVKDGKSNVRDAKFLFAQCFGGGFLDDLQKAFDGSNGPKIKWVGGSGAKHDEVGFGQRTAAENKAEPRFKLTDAEKKLVEADRPHTFWTAALLEQLNKDQPIEQAINEAAKADKWGVNAAKPYRDLAKKLLQQAKIDSPQENETGQSISANDGNTITLKDPGAKSHHAILWAGTPDRARDFNDIEDVRNALIANWGKPDDKNVTITVLYGDGETRGTDDKRELPKDWKAQEATRETLRETIKGLKDKLGPEEQFFFYATDHGGSFTDMEEDQIDVGPGAVDEEVLSLSAGELGGILADPFNVPTLSIQYSNLVELAPVFFNEVFLGNLVPGRLVQTFLIPEDVLSPSNLVRIENHGASEFSLLSKTFYTGDIGLVPDGIIVPEPATFALLGLGLAGMGAWAFLRIADLKVVANNRREQYEQ